MADRASEELRRSSPESVARTPSIDVESRLSRLALYALGFNQAIAVGTLFYAFAIVVAPLSRDLARPVSWTLGCVSLATLVGGLPSPWIGRIIDRHGAFWIMTAGSVIASAGLAGIAASQGLVSLTLALVLVQLATSMTLAEAAFPALVHADRLRAPRLISGITLFSALAPAFFWPLTQGLLVHMTWRQVYLVFAALNLMVCTPIYAVVLRGLRPEPPPSPATQDPDPPPRSDETVPATDQARTMRAITIAFCLMSYCYTGVNYGFVPALGALGAATAGIVAAGVLMAPSGVAARFLEAVLARWTEAVNIARLAAVLLVLALLLPVLAPAASPIILALFMILLGMSQGLFAIVRGTLPLAICGSRRYGAELGTINASRRLFIAVAPFGFGFSMAQVGAAGAFVVTAAVAAAALAFLFVNAGGTRRD